LQSKTPAKINKPSSKVNKLTPRGLISNWQKKYYFWIMEIKIRSYQIKDAQAILEIINYNILNATALYDYEPRTLENQMAILEEKLSKGFPIVVAAEEETVVGFGYYSEFRFREAYKFTVEHSVYAHPNHIGKGIGKLILKNLIDLAKAQKLHTMIGVIDAENQSSIEFHKKFGFEIAGTIKESGFKFNRWLHSVFMQKML
jgi:L-amino acid N-acyltransferase YncA